MLPSVTPSSRHGTATATAAASPPFTNALLSNDHLRFVFATALQLLVGGIVAHVDAHLGHLTAKAAILNGRIVNLHRLTVGLPTSPATLTDIMGPVTHFSMGSWREPSDSSSMGSPFSDIPVTTKKSVLFISAMVALRYPSSQRIRASPLANWKGYLVSNLLSYPAVPYSALDSRPTYLG